MITSTRRFPGSLVSCCSSSKCYDPKNGRHAKMLQESVLSMQQRHRVHCCKTLFAARTLGVERNGWNSIVSLHMCAKQLQLV